MQRIWNGDLLEHLDGIHSAFIENPETPCVFTNSHVNGAQSRWTQGVDQVDKFFPKASRVIHVDEVDFFHAYDEENFADDLENPELFEGGGYSTVYLYQNSAVKRFDVTSLESEKLEVGFQTLLGPRSNILRCLSFGYSPHFKRLVAILPRMSCTLDSYFLNVANPPVNRRVEMSLEIAKALQFMHDASHIFHLDLKPKNILCDEEHHIQIADFGAAISAANPSAKNSRGTAPYLDPHLSIKSSTEVVRFSVGCDIWSLGLILFQVLFHVKDVSVMKEFRYDLSASWTSWTSWKIWASGGPLKKLFDRRVLDAFNQDQVEKCDEIVRKCLQSTNRPTAGDVVDLLEKLQRML